MLSFLERMDVSFLSAGFYTWIDWKNFYYQKLLVYKVCPESNENILKMILLKNMF